MKNQILCGWLMCLAPILISTGTSRAGQAPERLFEVDWQDSLLRLDPGGQERPVLGPAALALGPAGEIYVLDVLAERIQVLDRSGRLLKSLGLTGWADSLAVAEDGSLALWRRHLGQVDFLDPEGLLIDSLAVSKHLGTPRSLAWGATGELEMENAFGERFVLGRPDAHRSLARARLGRRHGPAGSRVDCGVQLLAPDRVRIARWDVSEGLSRGREADGRRWIEPDLGQHLLSVRLLGPCFHEEVLLAVELADGPGRTRRQILRLSGERVVDRFDLPAGWLYVPYASSACDEKQCVLMHPVESGMQFWSWRTP